MNYGNKYNQQTSNDKKEETAPKKKGVKKKGCGCGKKRRTY
ncbi:hypothetical protein ACLM5H_01155 [Fredinandcohnia humi]